MLFRVAQLHLEGLGRIDRVVDAHRVADGELVLTGGDDDLSRLQARGDFHLAGEAATRLDKDLPCDDLRTVSLLLLTFPSGLFGLGQGLLIERARVFSVSLRIT